MHVVTELLWKEYLTAKYSHYQRLTIMSLFIQLFFSRKNRVIKCELVHILHFHGFKRTLPATSVEQCSRNVKRILKCRKCFAKIKIFYNSTAKIKIIIAQDSSVTLYHFVLNIWRYYEVDLAFYNFCQQVLLFLSINLARQSSLKHIKSFCSAWFCSVMLQQVI